MPSVIVEWFGRCPKGEQRRVLLDGYAALARASERRLEAGKPVRPALLDGVAEQRSRGISDLPYVRDHRSQCMQLDGEALVSLEVFGGGESARRAAIASGVEIVGVGESAYLVLDGSRVEGLDFELYDPRGLYPRGNRVAAYCLCLPESPLLDGWLVRVEDGAICNGHGEERIQRADWLLSPPCIQLRYMWEEWMDLLLSWTKYFFVSNLGFWRHESLSVWQEYRQLFDDLREEADQLVRDAVLQLLLQNLETESDDWQARIASMT